MIDEHQWAWLEEQLTGDYDHVLIASTVPILLAPTLHYIEAWNEAICSGAWGSVAAKLGERLRRALDLEHWAAFQESFHRMMALITEVAGGRRGQAPATIVMLGGDVHQAYLETVGFRSSAGVSSAVYQAVCSPFRNQLGRRERSLLRVVRRSRLARWFTPRLAHSAGVRDPDVRWRVRTAAHLAQPARMASDRRTTAPADDRNDARRSRPELYTSLLAFFAASTNSFVVLYGIWTLSQRTNSSSAITDTGVNSRQLNGIFADSGSM